MQNGEIWKFTYRINGKKRHMQRYVQGRPGGEQYGGTHDFGG
jgi:hypothetical protein